jgi:hypothetical protein
MCCSVLVPVGQDARYKGGGVVFFGKLRQFSVQRILRLDEIALPLLFAG